MTATTVRTTARRQILRFAGLAAALCVAPFLTCAWSAEAPVKIGILGSGNVGAGVGELWVKAGHEVMFSSLNIEKDKALAARLGPKAHAGTPREAAKFGEVVLIAVPYKALPQVAKDFAEELRGKVVLDAGNPDVVRDGVMAEGALRKGAGLASAEYLPGVRLVRAYSTYPATRLLETAFHTPRYAIPLAADDAKALAVAQRLVADSGFDGVAVGPLSRAREFDRNQPVFGKALTTAELRGGLGLKP